eukprot:gene10977-12983_t
MCIQGKGSKDETKGLTTLDELAKHSLPGDMWTAVHGRVLDISQFVDKHPGGQVIKLAAGRDATVLFETYHPNGVSMAVLDKYEIGKLEKSPFAPYYSWDSPFYTTLKKRVVEVLKQKNLTRRGSAEIQVKAVIILTGFWTSLAAMCLVSNLTYAYMWAIAMGFWAAFVGTCIQHDGNHGAFSGSSRLNTVAGWTLDMIGASAFTWEVQHMLGHHPYTNLLDDDGWKKEDARDKSTPAPKTTEVDQESDPDVFSSYPFMRMHPSHPRVWYHKFQHLYAPILFMLMTMTKVFHQDWELAIGKRLYHIDATCRYGDFKNVARFAMMKLLSLGYMAAAPCLAHGIGHGLGLFVIGHMACGELLALMFIVNHVIEGVAYARKSDPAGPRTDSYVTPMVELQNAVLEAAATTDEPVAKIPLNDWAAVQCQTSVNWAPGSWFWNHFSGGLSHQIEHHLFPSICHTNYFHIQVTKSPYYLHASV